jgi:hypothetical protein
VDISKNPLITITYNKQIIYFKKDTHGESSRLHHLLMRLILRLSMKTGLQNLTKKNRDKKWRKIYIKESDIPSTKYREFIKSF